MKYKKNRGYTLIELIVSVGLFALVMTLAAGAYLIIIGINRQTQGISSGINNLSFALETMTRTIRTGSAYSCTSSPGVDCTGGTSFYVKNSSGSTVSYTTSGGALTQTIGGVGVALTDPSITITSLQFYTTGVKSYTTNGNTQQARVTIVVSGTVASGTNKGQTVPFTVETAATMRGTDL